MPRQTPSASDFTSVVRSSAVANDVASKPAGTPGAAKASAAAVRSGGGLASLGAIGSIVKQSVVAKAIAPPPVRATVVTVPVVNPLTVQTTIPEAYIVAYNTSGIAQWAAKFESQEYDMIFGLVTDSNGNVYAAGRGGNSSPIKVYSSNGVLFGNISNRGAGDAYIIKYNSSGIVQWVARGPSTSGSDAGFAISIDSSGNVYMCGTSESEVAYAFSSNGTQFTRSIPNAGQTNAFIIKFDSAGIIQWLAGITSAYGDTGSGIAVDGSGNVFVTGYCANSGAPATALNSDGTSFATQINSQGANDAFLVKYNSSGFVQWVVDIGSTGSDIGNAITVDPSGYIFVVGQSNNTPIVFNLDSTSFGTLSNSGSNDAFVVKYATNGVVQWMARIASGGSDIPYGVVTDSAGNVYIVGQSGGDVTTTAYNGNGFPYATTLPSSGGSDAFIVKYSGDGFVQWVTKVGSSGNDAIRSIAIDGSDNLYVVGDSGAGPLTALSRSGPSLAITNTGAIDAFIAKYNSAGAVQWLTKIAGTDNDYARAVAFDKLNGRVFVAGQYTSSPLTISNAA